MYNIPSTTQKRQVQVLLDLPTYMFSPIHQRQRPPPAPRPLPWFPCLACLTRQVPEKIHNLDHGYDAAIPEWNLFIAFATWWAVLIVEAMLLAYSLYILLAINPGTALRSTVLTWRTELISIVAMVLVSGTAGGINIQTLSLRCADSKGAIYLGNTTRSCNESIATINWVWLGFLMVPLVIQVAIWRQVLLANQKIGAYDEITGRGGTVTDPAVAMAPALDRVIKTIVKPLAWYPLVFLITSALYIVWIVSLYSAEREQGWARKVGPASSLVFATKGISTAGVYIVTLDRGRRERGLRDQVRGASNWATSHSLPCGRSVVANVVCGHLGQSRRCCGHFPSFGRVRGAL